MKIAEIFIGVNAVDYSGYPDCRPEYIAAYEAMANLATKACTEGKMRLKIRTPLLMLSKADIIRQGIALGVDYGMTTTCYDPLPDGRACGRCDSCHLRRKGFQGGRFRRPGFFGTVARNFRSLPEPSSSSPRINSSKSPQGSMRISMRNA